MGLRHFITIFECKIFCKTIIYHVYRLKLIFYHMFGFFRITKWWWWKPTGIISSHSPSMT